MVLRRIGEFSPYEVDNLPSASRDQDRAEDCGQPDGFTDDDRCTRWYDICPPRRVRTFLAVICLLATTACDQTSPTGPSVPLNQPFTLAPGESAAVSDTNVRLLFSAVTTDSRCPADALCIQLGDAIVRLRVSNTGVPSEYDLHTEPGRAAEISHGPLRIRLVQLQPYPFSDRRIAPGDYRARR